MREIKFRAWDKIDNRMYCNVQSGAYIDPDEIILFEKILELDRYAVMQYTGLLDKHGKEIYEGDIIKNTYDEFMIVVFLNGSFQLSNIKYPNANLGLLDGYASFLEVIGNIHENPELMEELK